MKMNSFLLLQLALEKQWVENFVIFLRKKLFSACESGNFCTFAVALFGNVSEKAV